jgi:Myb-like DNA-binding domain
VQEEDEALIKLVNQFGAKRWSIIAIHLQGRIGACQLNKAEHPHICDVLVIIRNARMLYETV